MDYDRLGRRVQKDTVQLGTEGMVTKRLTEKNRIVTKEAKGQLLAREERERRERDETA